MNATPTITPFQITMVCVFNLSREGLYLNISFSWSGLKDGPPGSPSSATTITHAGRPYPVTPDERSTLPMRPRHIRRRSSHLQRWIQEQQCHTSASPSVVDLTNDLDEPRVGTPCNPYLAYPHISLTPARHAKDDLDSLHSYDLIADDDIPAPETVRVEVRTFGPANGCAAH